MEIGRKGLATVCAAAAAVAVLVTPTMQSWWIAGPLWMVAFIAGGKWLATFRAVDAALPQPPEQRVWLHNVSLKTLSDEGTERPGEMHYQFQARQERYAGKWMDVVGYVEQVSIWSDESGAVQAVETPNVRLSTRLGLYFNMPKCRDRLVLLNQGDRIQVIGKLMTFSRDHINFEECEFVQPTSSITQ